MGGDTLKKKPAFLQNRSRRGKEASILWKTETRRGSEKKIFGNFGKRRYGRVQLSGDYDPTQVSIRVKIVERARLKGQANSRRRDPVGCRECTGGKKRKKGSKRKEGKRILRKKRE